MKPVALTVDGERGYLFEAAQHEGSVAFVPEESFSDHRTTAKGLDEAAYFTSGWAAKNARFDPTGTTKHVFPDLDRPMNSVDAPPVAHFLQRLRHAYSVEFLK